VKRTAHNARLTMLVNEFAAAVLLRLRQENGGEWFSLPVNGQIVHVAVTDGESGILLLIDSYTLAAMKVSYPQWETVGIALLERCVTKDGLTDVGREIWQSMVKDMGATVAGGNHA